MTSCENTLRLAHGVDVHIFFVHLLTMGEALSHRFFREITCFVRRLIAIYQTFFRDECTEYIISARVTLMALGVVTRSARSNSDEAHQGRVFEHRLEPVKYCIEES
jgi:hypothetical protein